MSKDNCELYSPETWLMTVQLRKEVGETVHDEIIIPTKSFVNWKVVAIENYL